jgi:hypothetical protein
VISLLPLTKQNDDDSGLLVNLSAAHLTDHATSIHILRLPLHHVDILPPTGADPTSASLDIATEIKPFQQFVIRPDTLQIGPLREIVCWLQCCFPGRFSVPSKAELVGGELHGAPRAGRRYPEVGWLLCHEAIIRENFGCTFFRCLLRASMEEEAVVQA